jgi:methionine-gamma-lyase
MATARYHKVKIGEHEVNAETLMLGYGYDPSLSEGSVNRRCQSALNFDP